MIVALGGSVVDCLFAGVVAGMDVRFGGHQALPCLICYIALYGIHERGATGVVAGVDIRTEGGESRHHPCVVIAHEGEHERGAAFPV